MVYVSHKTFDFKSTRLSVDQLFQNWNFHNSQPFLSQKPLKPYLTLETFWKQVEKTLFSILMSNLTLKCEKGWICWPIGQQTLTKDLKKSKHHLIILFPSKKYPKPYLSFLSFWKWFKILFFVVFVSFWAFPKLKCVDLLT